MMRLVSLSLSRNAVFARNLFSISSFVIGFCRLPRLNSSISSSVRPSLVSTMTHPLNCSRAVFADRERYVTFLNRLGFDVLNPND
jgi:hypothetical protein